MSTIPAGGFIDTPTTATTAQATKEPKAGLVIPPAAVLRKDPPTLHVYDAADGIRWSLVAANGPKLADGGQGYQGTRARVVDFLGRFLRFDKSSAADVACKRHKSKSGKCRTFEIGDNLGTPAGR
jgi:hypothetical protein